MPAKTRKKNQMAVLLNDYDAVRVPDISGAHKFFIHMDSANDIVLADLATELNTYDGNIIYNHDRYIATNGVRKYMDPLNGSWRAVLTARKVE